MAAIAPLTPLRLCGPGSGSVIQHDDIALLPGERRLFPGFGQLRRWQEDGTTLEEIALGQLSPLHDPIPGVSFGLHTGLINRPKDHRPGWACCARRRPISRGSSRTADPETPRSARRR